MITSTATEVLAWRLALNGTALERAPVVGWQDNPDGTAEPLVLDGPRASSGAGEWALLLERGETPDNAELLVEHLRYRLKALADRDDLASTVAGRLRRGDALTLAELVGIDDIGSEFEARALLEGSGGDDLRALGLAVTVDAEGNLSGAELPWHEEPAACVRARHWLRGQS